MGASRYGQILAALTVIGTAPTQAQTGLSLFTMCASASQVEQMTCAMYISGFVQGLQLAKDLQGVVCVPENLTGMEATEVFVRTLRDMAKAAKSGKGVGLDVNPFFTGPQTSSLAAALGMNYKCPKDSTLK